MPSAPNAITRYHVNPAFTKARDIYADGAEIDGGQRMLHLSGQVGIRPDGTTSPDFAEQCDQALINLHAVLKAAAMAPEHVVKLTCYVVGQQPLAALYECAPAAPTERCAGIHHADRSGPGRTRMADRDRGDRRRVTSALIFQLWHPIVAAAGGGQVQQAPQRPEGIAVARMLRAQTSYYRSRPRDQGADEDHFSIAS